MRLKIKTWKFTKLLLSLLLPGIIVLEAMPVTADEINNTAVFGGDNIGSFNTNNTTFRAGEADLQITKTANKSAAEPGDTVIYRVAIRNTGAVSASNLTLNDTLPLGLRLAEKSVQGSLTDGSTTSEVEVSTTPAQNRTVAINYAGSIPPQGTLSVVYAVTVTPDGMRGSGRNLAVATTATLTSNTASHLLRIRPGILSDCATLIGRVFVDKNFDGEQQRGEPGVPNAVIFMDDGNRIITDANGMYSVANVISGNRTATLDYTSLPGYIQAPNLYKIKNNSQSRLVRLAPGSMARINFAVTPAFGEQKAGAKKIFAPKSSKGGR
ncbi:conserved repeat protein [Rivularia sp. PCC 7116]|uniref:DUF11 domain-containing protein n=1 Tax=Rivularia sp. PCC 7116 TaxID=373994 RepID=UPI00029EE4E2|nr:DUF11 domain-containing protein [Rivularia sp. PCC 7116]AFY59173.1 conserved repeat protein [Rivularia sp. PCC 7116]